MDRSASIANVLAGLLLAAVGSVAVAQPPAGLREQNWHQWRGPEATGVSPAADPPVVWSESQNIRWKVELPGGGTSAPIVWEDRVYLLTAINTGEVDPSRQRPEDQPKRVFDITHPNVYYDVVVLCLDRESGRELWRQTATRLVPHEGHHSDNDFASASPTTDGQRLYCWFGSAEFYCYTLDGDLLWSRDLGKAYVGASLGEGGSPVMRDGKLVVVRDHSRQSSIEVLDAATGETLWKRDRDEPNAWATPVIAAHDGKTQVITAASNFVRSYDLASGEIVWQCDGLTGNVIPCPIVGDELVYCMSGYEGYSLLAIPLSTRGDVKGKEVAAWSREADTPYIPSPLLTGGRLYYTKSNSAILTCVDAGTGEVIIGPQRLPGLQNVYASPVAAAGKIYFAGREGTTVVLADGPEFEVISQNTLDETFDASPALAGDSIFLRGDEHLYRIATDGSGS